MSPPPSLPLLASSKHITESTQRQCAVGKKMHALFFFFTVSRGTRAGRRSPQPRTMLLVLISPISTCAGWPPAAAAARAHVPHSSHV